MQEIIWWTSTAIQDTGGAQKSRARQNQHNLDTKAAGLQATLPNGALDSRRLDMGVGGVLRHSRSHSVNDTLGATTSHVIASARNSLQTITTEMGSFNLSSNTKGNHGESRTDWDLIDINGDGLPDRVRSASAGESGLFVRLNLGYRFGVEERWGGLDTCAPKRA